MAPEPFDRAVCEHVIQWLSIALMPAPKDDLYVIATLGLFKMRDALVSAVQEIDRLRADLAMIEGQLLAVLKGDPLPPFASTMVEQVQQVLAEKEADVARLTQERETLAKAVLAAVEAVSDAMSDFDRGYQEGYGAGLDESSGDPRVARIEAGFVAIQAATNGEYSREDQVVLDALQAGREFAVRLARREQHIQQLLRERAVLSPPPAPSPAPAKEGGATSDGQ